MNCISSCIPLSPSSCIIPLSLRRGRSTSEGGGAALPLWSAITTTVPAWRRALITLLRERYKLIASAKQETEQGQKNKRSSFAVIDANSSCCHRRRSAGGASEAAPSQEGGGDAPFWPAGVVTTSARLQKKSSWRRLPCNMRPIALKTHEMIIMGSSCSGCCVAHSMRASKKAAHSSREGIWKQCITKGTRDGGRITSAPMHTWWAIDVGGEPSGAGILRRRACCSEPRTRRKQFSHNPQRRTGGTLGGRPPKGEARRLPTHHYSSLVDANNNDTRCPVPARLLVAAWSWPRWWSCRAGRSQPPARTLLSPLLLGVAPPGRRSSSFLSLLHCSCLLLLILLLVRQFAAARRTRGHPPRASSILIVCCAPPARCFAVC